MEGEVLFASVARGLDGMYNSSFATGDDVPRDAVLGLLDVNAWHNLVHISTGALGLATFASLAGPGHTRSGLGRCNWS